MKTPTASTDPCAQTVVRLEVALARCRQSHARYAQATNDLLTEQAREITALRSALAAQETQ